MSRRRRHRMQGWHAVARKRQMQCRAKRRYPSFAAAELDAVKWRLNIVPCLFCGQWHLTNSNGRHWKVTDMRHR